MDCREGARSSMAEEPLAVSGAINSFAFETETIDGVLMGYFQYTCAFPADDSGAEIALDTCDNVTTPETYAGNALNYLDRQPPLLCEQGKVLTRFQLRSRGDQMWFEYSCCGARLSSRPYRVVRTRKGDTLSFVSYR